MVADLIQVPLKRTPGLANEAAAIIRAREIAAERNRRRSLEVQHRADMLGALDRVGDISERLSTARRAVQSAQTDLDEFEQRMDDTPAEMLDKKACATRCASLRDSLGAAQSHLESVEAEIVKLDTEIEAAAVQWWRVAEPPNELRLAHQNATGDGVPYPDFGDPVPSRAELLAIKEIAKRFLGKVV